MKSKIIYFVLLTFLGCSELKELQTIEPINEFYGIDFTKYTERGFFITPEKYNGQYESVGIIKFSFYPGGKYRTTAYKSNPNYNQSGDPVVIPVKTWIMDKLDLYVAMDSVYNFCISKGADALVNFSAININYVTTGHSNDVKVNGIEINGFAIKRKL